MKKKISQKAVSTGYMIGEDWYPCEAIYNLCARC